MTGDQFDTLVKLMRGQESAASTRGARLVLVDGFTQVDASLAVGTTTNNINNAVQRWKSAYEKIRKAYPACQAAPYSRPIEFSHMKENLALKGQARPHLDIPDGVLTDDIARDDIVIASEEIKAQLQNIVNTYELTDKQLLVAITFALHDVVPNDRLYAALEGELLPGLTEVTHDE